MPHYHTSHLRSGRFSESGRIFSITAVTHCRQPWFHDFFVGRLLIDELRLAEEQDLATSLCWVVMPDHFHWLLQLGQCDLEKLLQQVKSRSANRWVMTHACTDPVTSGEAEVIFEGPQAYSVKAKGTVTQKGKTQPYEMAMRMQHVSADCGNVKPASEAHKQYQEQLQKMQQRPSRY